MKQLNFIILILYFCLLVSGSLIFYYQYYPKVMDPINPGQRIISNESNQTVYFKTENNLFRIFANNSIDRLGAPRMETIAEKIIFNNLAMVDKNALYIDDQKEKSTISRLDLLSGEKDIIISSDRPGLNNFDTFSEPVLSPNKKILIFKASQTGRDSLLSYNIKSNSITNLTSKLNLDQIYDYVWQNDKILIIAGGNQTDYVIIRHNLQSLKTDIVKQGNNKMNNLRVAGDFVFFLKNEIINNSNTADLISMNLNSQKQKSISSVGEKNIVSNYDISDDGLFVILEIRNLDDNSSNLSVAKADGSNLLQITTDNKSSIPVFLPRSNEFVYWQKDDGLYKNTVIQNKPVKLINLVNNIEQIFAWR